MAAKKKTAKKKSLEAGSLTPSRPAIKKKARTDSESSDVSLELEGMPLDKSHVSKMRAQYDYEDLMTSPEFDKPEARGWVKRIDPKDFNINYARATCLKDPLVFTCDPKELGMSMPDAATFTVRDVMGFVGKERIIDVVIVSTQESASKRMDEFVEYYETPPEKREGLFNVLSLEFSQTPMDEVVKSPALVREIDWVERHWPDTMRYRCSTVRQKPSRGFSFVNLFPKVQNYCLMSVAGCYTDFHIDFGGTSVWYHVLKGRKIFWIVEPTEHNILLYEAHLKASAGEVDAKPTFFGRIVENCLRVVLEPGTTMMIPSGWIHAVYTPIDSLVFGGNFLHTYRAEMQINVLKSENRIHIGNRYRFPYFEETFWYVIANFVRKATGRMYLNPKIPPVKGYEFVGQSWVEAGGKTRVISLDDISVVKQEDEDGEPEPVPLGMYAEDGDKVKSGEELREMLKTENFGLEDEFSEDELSSFGPLVFYDEVSHLPLIGADGSTKTAHRDSLQCNEPVMVFDDEFLSTVTSMEHQQYLAMHQFLSKKKKSDVAVGITRPASLLNAFYKVLEHRTTLFNDCGMPSKSPRRPSKSPFAFHSTPPSSTPRNKKPAVAKELASPESRRSMDEALYEQSLKEKVEENDVEMQLRSASKKVEATASNESASSKVPSDPSHDSTVEEEAHSPELAPIVLPEEPSPRFDSSVSQPMDEDLTVEVDVGSREDNIPPVVSPELSSTALLKKKAVKRKSDADKPKGFVLLLWMKKGLAVAKSKSKKLMPAVIGGVPTAAIQDDTVQLPSYGYDPKNAVAALGKNPLPSMYRKTTNMASAPKAEKIVINRLGTDKEEKKEREPETLGEVISEKAEPSTSAARYSDGKGKDSTRKPLLVKTKSRPSDDARLAYHSPLPPPPPSTSDVRFDSAKSRGVLSRSPYGSGGSPNVPVWVRPPPGVVTNAPTRDSPVVSTYSPPSFPSAMPFSVASSSADAETFTPRRQRYSESERPSGHQRLSQATQKFPIAEPKLITNPQLAQPIEVSQEPVKLETREALNKLDEVMGDMHVPLDPRPLPPSRSLTAVEPQVDPRRSFETPSLDGLKGSALTATLDDLMAELQ